eukprot:6578324-Prorocentrum_lima.AAC.1
MLGACVGFGFRTKEPGAIPGGFARTLVQPSCWSACKVEAGEGVGATACVVVPSVAAVGERWPGCSRWSCAGC